MQQRDQKAGPAEIPKGKSLAQEIPFSQGSNWTSLPSAFCFRARGTTNYFFFKLLVVPCRAQGRFLVPLWFWVWQGGAQQVRVETSLTLTAVTKQDPEPLHTGWRLQMSCRASATHTIQPSTQGWNPEPPTSPTCPRLSLGDFRQVPYCRATPYSGFQIISLILLLWLLDLFLSYLYVDSRSRTDIIWLGDPCL